MVQAQRDMPGDSYIASSERLLALRAAILLECGLHLSDAADFIEEAITIVVRQAQWFVMGCAPVVVARYVNKCVHEFLEGTGLNARLYVVCSLTHCAVEIQYPLDRSRSIKIQVRRE